MRVTSITPMKNEAPFLLEWVAYHRLIGVNDMLVFTNDCTDGTDRMLERLDEMGVLRHYANPSMINGNPKHHLQVIRYINALLRPKRSDWVVSLDVDEFICVNVGQGRLRDLFQAVPEANVWSMSQLNFGHGGVITYEDKPLTDQFRYCWDKEAAYHTNANRRGTKTMTHKSAQAVEIHNHSPVFDKEHLDKVKIVNGSGQRLRHLQLWRDVKSLDAPYYGYDMVQLNHYALRSVESFLLKVARGNANHADLGYGMPYWRRYDQNDQYDDNITRWTPRVQELMGAFMNDPELRDLHQQAVETARNKIEELKRQPNVLSLLKQINRYVTNRPGKLDQAAEAEATSAAEGH